MLQVGLNAGSLAALTQTSNGVPKGYLRVLIFNQDSVLVDQRTVQLSQAALTSYEVLQTGFLPIGQDCYMSVYVGNESAVDVLFDDVQVEYRQGLLVQETQYDPWGLDLAGVGYSSPGLRLLNQYLFTGKERQLDLGLGWSDYGARFYDPSRGPVWLSVDPLADQMQRWSPYAFSFANALRFIDPNGMAPKEATYEEEKLKGPHPENTIPQKIAQEGGGGNLPVVNGIPTVALGTAEVTGHLPDDAPRWAYRFSKMASAGHLEPYRSNGPNPYSPYNPDVVGMEVPLSTSYFGFGMTGKVGLAIANGGVLGYWAIDSGFSIDNLVPSSGVGLNFFMADKMSTLAPSSQFGPFLGDSRYYSVTVPGLSGGYSYSVNADGTPNLTGYQTYSAGLGAGYSASYGQSHAAKIFSFGNPFSNTTRGVEPK